MAHESKFKAGQMYGADDINNTMSILTDGGVFNITTPNEICTSISGEGITEQDGKMEVTILDGQIHVANGSCIMADGSTFTIYGDGETLDYTVGVTNYVYVENDKVLFDNVLKCTTDEPSGDYVIFLAVINTNGTITDKRTFARSRLEKIGSNVSEVMSITISDSDLTKTYDNGNYIYTLEKTVSIPEKYNYAYLYGSGYHEYSPNSQLLRVSDGMFWRYKFENSYEHGFLLESSGIVIGEGVGGDGEAFVVVTCKDRLLTLKCTNYRYRPFGTIDIIFM